MYLDLIKEDNEIRAKGVAAKVLAKWKSQGGRRHIEGSYGPPVKPEMSRAAMTLPPSSTTSTTSSSSGSVVGGSSGVDLVSVTGSLSSTIMSSATPPVGTATVSVTVPPSHLGNIKSEFLAPPSAPLGSNHTGTPTDSAADTYGSGSSDHFEEYGESEGDYNH
jgi:hypothetical protein